MNYRQLLEETLEYSGSPFKHFYKKMVEKYGAQPGSFFVGNFSALSDDPRHVETIVAEFTRNNPVLVPTIKMVAITPGAAEFMEENGIKPNDLLDRLYRGDIGTVCDYDQIQNYLSILSYDARILAVYPIKLKNNTVENLWIIHYPKASETTMLMPDEY